MNFLTDLEISGFPLWVVLLICAGVFLAAFMDSIAGGGGIISVPTYLLAFNGLPTYFALGTNKLSSCIGLFISSGRFIKNGYVKWRSALVSVLFGIPGVFLGSFIAGSIDKSLLRTVFALFLLVLGGRELFAKGEKSE